jgi:hypothetical protein
LLSSSAACLNYDLPFHRAIVAAADNGHLLRAWETLGFEIRACLFLTRDNSDPKKIAEEHLPIVKTLEAEDGRKAGALLRRHCLKFAKEVMTLESPSSVPKIYGIGRRPSQTYRHAAVARRITQRSQSKINATICVSLSNPAQDYFPNKRARTRAISRRSKNSRSV